MDRLSYYCAIDCLGREHLLLKLHFELGIHSVSALICYNFIFIK